MNDFVSVNMKYYKEIKAGKLLKHNKRETVPDYVIGDPKKNLTHTFMDMSISDIIEMVNADSRRYRRAKVFQKNPNVLIDGVIAFSRDQVLFLQKKFGEDLANEKIMDYAKKFAFAVREKYGFEPVNLSFHLDEGHVDNGEVKKNFHAHLSFLNYDFKKHKSVLRTMKNNDFSIMQDILGEVFSEIGFRRGKRKSSNKHLERTEYIEMAKKIEELSKNLKNTDKLIEEKNQMLFEKSNQVVLKKVEVFKLESEIRRLKATRADEQITIQEFNRKIRELEKTGRALSKEIKRYDDTNLGQYFKKLKMDFKEFRASKKKIKKQVSTFKSEEIEVIEADAIEPLYKLLAKIYNEYKHLMQLAVDYNEKMNEYNHLAVNYDRLDDNYQKILADYKKQNKLTITLQKENSQLKNLLQSTSENRLTNARDC